MFLEGSLNIFVLFVSFIVIIKAADYLIGSSSEIGRRLGISKFVIGLTIVAVGTSLPELFTSLVSIYTSTDSAPFILGAVLGSNIANILLVFAIFLLLTKKYQANVKIVDIVFLLISTGLLIYFLLIEKITILEGYLLTFIFLLYLFSAINSGKKKELIEEAEQIEPDQLEKKATYIIVSVFIFSLVGLNLGARGIIYAIENLGVIMNIPIEYLTLTTVAFATSLPEIVVTYGSAKKGEASIALGNIIGSNISNILFVLGVSALITDITLDSSAYMISIVYIVISTALILFFLHQERIKKYHGVFLLMLYFSYIYFIYFG